jgi:hypothetical protein
VAPTNAPVQAPIHPTFAPASRPTTIYVPTPIGVRKVPPANGKSDMKLSRENAGSESNYEKRNRNLLEIDEPEELH